MRLGRPSGHSRRHGSPLADEQFAREDLQSLTLKRYGRGLAAVIPMPVVAVNLVTIAADLQAGRPGVGLLAGVDSRWLVAPLGRALAGLLLVGA